MDADKTIPLVNLPPLRFVGVPLKQVITDNIQGARYPEISVAVVISVGVPVE